MAGRGAPHGGAARRRGHARPARRGPGTAAGLVRHGGSRYRGRAGPARRGPGTAAGPGQHGGSRTAQRDRTAAGPACIMKGAEGASLQRLCRYGPILFQGTPFVNRFFAGPAAPGARRPSQELFRGGDGEKSEAVGANFGETTESKILLACFVPFLYDILLISTGGLRDRPFLMAGRRPARAAEHRGADFRCGPRGPADGEV